MSNEQIKNTAEPAEPKEKIFDSKDLENKSHEEQILHLDGAISHLSLLSEDVENAVAQSELERSGKKGVIDQSSLFDRAGLGIKKFLRGQEGYDEKLSTMARKVTDKSLDNLEKGLGSQLLEAKTKLAKHEATAKNDLAAVKKLIDPEQFSLMEMKMSQEKDLLVMDKDQKEAELQEKVAEYPAGQKYEKIDNLLGEYGDIESAINDKRLTLENDIRIHKSAFNKIKGEGETSQEIKEKLKEKMEILNGQYEEIKNREKAVKERINSLKSNQKELDPYVKRLQTVGKTKTEIIEASKARLENKKNPANKPENPKKDNEQASEKTTNKPEPEKSTVAETTNKKEPEKSTAAETINKKEPATVIKVTGINPEKKAVPENKEEEMNNKLKEIIKTPTQWANYIKSTDKNLALSTKVNVITAFDKQFKPRKNVNGLEAASFLTSLLKNKNITESEEKARKLIEALVN